MERGVKSLPRKDPHWCDFVQVNLLLANLVDGRLKGKLSDLWEREWLLGTFTWTVEAPEAAILVKVQ